MKRRVPASGKGKIMQPTDVNPRHDMLIGALGFFGGNILLGVMLYLIGLGLDALPRSVSQSSAMNTGTIFLFCCFPGLANVGAEIYLFIKRRWIALGVLMGITIGTILASIAMAMLIASGFTLV